MLHIAETENRTLRRSMMKTGGIFTVLPILILLAMLSPPALAAGNSATQKTGDNVAGSGNHEALEKYYEEEARKRHEVVAKYYEDEAAKMQAKATELKLLLEHYEEKSYLYGKKAQDLQAHTEALVRKYEKAARQDVAEAASHRQIASKLKDKNYAASRAERAERVSAFDGFRQNSASPK
ncbi:hypothetical protein [Nitrosovibrio sp. Nv6]|uniref:hypothetical protein n=1 Tax=Nitrosovibrio sp. Nv6 TaxID=1855340 RepID=UPI0008C530A6|nr:hypothetical protein [Nitrosovibrio sp. Nv6]SEO62677.1 hypothetical protein SAMN05216316_0648 [Nitrosovibrio sp. Nv6]